MPYFLWGLKPLHQPAERDSFPLMLCLSSEEATRELDRKVQSGEWERGKGGAAWHGFEKIYVSGPEPLVKEGWHFPP